jgi:uncharacterized protein YybS (DUF2232 family)
MQRLEAIRKFFLSLALTLLLFIGGVVLPPAAIAVLPLVPQPALVLGLNYGVGWALGVILVALGLLAVFAGGELALIFSFFALIAVLLFGFLGRLRAIEFLVLAVTSIMFTVAGGISLFLFGSWAGMIHEFRDSLMQHLVAATRMHERMGFPQDTLELLRERAPQIVETLLQLLPGLFFVSLALIVLANVLLLCRRFPERRSGWLLVDNFREWKGPEPLVWGLIVSGFVLFIPGLESFRIVAVNILVIISASYFAQGLAIIAYFFHKNNVPKFLRGVTYVLIFFQQIFTLLVIGLGLFDLWGDFRRLRKNDLNPSQAS